MNKDILEDMCRKAGLRPEARVAIRDGHILVADGLCTPAAKASLIKRGAIDVGEFPDGVYMTLWFWEDSGRYPVSGKPLLFDKNHDPHYDAETKKRGRINRAIDDAVALIEISREVHARPN